jgi:putative phosphoesterase
MIKIGILSDTHGYLPVKVKHFLQECDEIWHAGDWGNIAIAEELKKIKPLRGVWGNIDGLDIRKEFPEFNQFKVENINVCMLHIGGYPEKYSPQFRKILQSSKPDLMVCGHSHILMVMKDATNNLLHINPGAAGTHGFHQKITAIRLKISGSNFSDLEVFEMPKFSNDATE